MNNSQLVQQVKCCSFSGPAHSAVHMSKKENNTKKIKVKHKKRLEIFHFISNIIQIRLQIK